MYFFKLRQGNVQKRFIDIGNHDTVSILEKSFGTCPADTAGSADWVRLSDFPLKVWLRIE